MKRLPMVACILFTSSIALAVPARPLYEPARPAAPAALDLRGSTWFGKTYEKADMTILFEPTGRISWTHTNSTYTTGSWTLQGNSVYFEMNNKYCEFRGTLTGNVIDGTSTNVNGLRWRTVLQLQSTGK